MADTFDVDAIRASVDLARLAGQYFEVKHAGGKAYRYKALCPFHTEKTPSFVISEYHGKQRYKCYGCGEEGDVFSFYAAMHSLDIKADFPKICKALSNGAAGAAIPNAPLKKPPPRITSQPLAGLGPELMLRSGKEPVSSHPYLTADSGLLGYAAWYPNEDEPRYWTWGKRTPEDIAKWDALPFSTPRPIYGLEQLARKPDVQVVIVEDERIADAAQVLFLDLACISWPGGFEGIGSTDWTPLAGRQVVLIPRNDPMGEQIMRRLAPVLYAAGVGGIRGVEVDMIPQSELPGSPDVPAPEGWDLSHALESGWTPDTALTWAQRHATSVPNPTDKSNTPVPAPEATAESEAGADLPPPPAPTPAPPVAGTYAVPDAEPDAAPQQDAPESPRSPAIEEALASIASASWKAPSGVPGRPSAQKKRQAPAKQSEILEIEQEVDLPPEFTESGLACRFVDAHGEDWRYTAIGDSGRWYRWTGERWEEDIKRSRTWVMQQFCSKAQAGDGNLTRSQRERICTARMCSAILSLVATHPAISVSAGIWNADPLLLGVPGGAWDFRANRLIPGTREQHITRCTSFAPEFERAELWEKHVLMMCGGDQEKVNFLQQYAGYCATGETREQCFTFLYGLGQNGKGIFSLTLLNVLGYRDEYGNPVESMSYAGVAEADAFMATEAQRHTQEIAVLRNMRLVIVDETDGAKRWNEERIKKITGGAPLTAHRMQKDNESFAPQFKLLVCGNHKPALRGVGKAILRRLNMVHCPYEIPDEDKDTHIEEKLAVEYPRILGWILRGAELWRAGGLSRPEVIQADTQTYVQSEDVIGDWIEGMCKVDGEIETGAAYKNYCEWCKSEGHKEWSRRAWSNALGDRGYALRKSHGLRYLCGISLRTAADAREDHGIGAANATTSEIDF